MSCHPLDEVILSYGMLQDKLTVNLKCGVSGKFINPNKNWPTRLLIQQKKFLLSADAAIKDELHWPWPSRGEI